METTRLSSQGQIAIPRSLQAVHQWAAGQELVAIVVGDGILLRPKKPFQETTLGEVAGCLKYQGQPKTLGEIEAALGQGIVDRSYLQLHIKPEQ